MFTPDKHYLAAMGLAFKSTSTLDKEKKTRGQTFSRGGVVRCRSQRPLLFRIIQKKVDRRHLAKGWFIIYRNDSHSTRIYADMRWYVRIRRLIYKRWLYNELEYVTSESATRMGRGTLRNITEWNVKSNWNNTEKWQAPNSVLSSASNYNSKPQWKNHKLFDEISPLKFSTRWLATSGDESHHVVRCGGDERLDCRSMHV